MDTEFIAKYIPLYQKAAVLTVEIGFAGIAVAILLGLLCEIIEYFKIPVLRRIVAIYIEISRNTPLLIQLFFIYYGLPKIGIHSNAQVCGVVGLAFLGGSYMAEAFRSGVEAIDTIMPDLGLDVLFKGKNFVRLLGGLGVALKISLVSILISIILGKSRGTEWILKQPYPS